MANRSDDNTGCTSKIVEAIANTQGVAETTQQRAAAESASRNAGCGQTLRAGGPSRRETYGVTRKVDASASSVLLTAHG